MLVAAVPIFASSVVLYIEGRQSWHLRPGEVLFFSVMIGSIAVGEVIEMMFKDKRFTRWGLVLGAYFLVCIIASAVLYGMNVHHEFLSHEPEILSHGPVDADERILVLSVILAVVILVPGTFLEIVFDRVDRQDGAWRRPSWDS